MRCVFFTATVIASVAGAQEFPYTMNSHFTPPSYLACGDAIVGDSVFSTCGVIDPIASDYSEFTPNFAWVLVSDVPDGAGPRGAGGIGAAGWDATVTRMCTLLLGCGQTNPLGPPGEPGCGAICAVPVKASSWGRIKNKYRASAGR